MADYSNELSELRRRFIVSRQPPQYLTHYTDAAGAIGIIKNGKIWSSSFECMNDNGELRHGISLWREAVNDFLNSFVEHGEEKKTLLKNWAGFIEGEIELPSMRPYITSFICGEESAYHWSSYGNRGKGISIDINFKDVTQMGTSIIADVIYDDAQKQKIISDVISELEKFIKKWAGKQKDSDTLRDVIGALVIAIIVQSARFKRSSWKHENEWRVITLINASQGHDHIHGPIHFRNRGVDIVDFIELNYSQISADIVGITLGASANSMSSGSWKTLLRSKLLPTHLLRKSSLDIG
jgi:hypothetical protein